MPPSIPGQYIEMSPRFRAPGERFRAQLQVAWSPEDDAYVVSVTVYDGDGEEDLRSCVVGAPIPMEVLMTALVGATSDVYHLIRRTTDPFDSLA